MPQLDFGWVRLDSSTIATAIGSLRFSYANGNVNQDSPNPIIIIDEMNNPGPHPFPKHPVPKIHL
ncbi:unnamed protein product [Sphenostylis stenocarpa]|uniref:Uncharacterized protein n=1 Tax=Sphenostylis stenocarpa TaxID=92480 RepID=A0AA86VD03_9FABA|nr:unnamed protein product [Sphenostylis stenocarpa]